MKTPEVVKEQCNHERIFIQHLIDQAGLESVAWACDDCSREFIPLTRAQPQTPESEGERDAIEFYDSPMKFHRGADVLSASHPSQNKEVEQILNLCNHQIPFYAYGDNEAAVEMSHKLDKIQDLARSLLVSHPPKAEEGKRPFVCPVCGGQKIVSKPPHVAGDQQTWMSTGTAVYPCGVCNGTGLIWSAARSERA